MDAESNDALQATLARLKTRHDERQARMTDNEKLYQRVNSLVDPMWRYVAHAKRQWDKAGVPFVPEHLIEETMDRVIGSGQLGGLEDPEIRSRVRAAMDSLWAQMESAMRARSAKRDADRKDIPRRRKPIENGSH